MFTFTLDPMPLMRFISAVHAQTGRIESDVATAVHAMWQQLAHQKLRSSRDRYLAGLQAPQSTMHGTEISLVGMFPNMVENGYGPFDMRDTLLGPVQDRRVIGFGHGGAGTSFGGGTTPLGWPARAAVVGDPAGGYQWNKPSDPAGWRAVGRMLEQMFATHVKNQWGREGDFASGPKVASHSRIPAGPTRARHHKVLHKLDLGERADPYGLGWTSRTGNDVYARMQSQTEFHGRHRSQNAGGGGRLAGGGAEGAGYMTFRTISRNVSEGWFHPGIGARRLLDDIDHELPRMTHRVIETTVERAVVFANGGGLT